MLYKDAFARHSSSFLSDSFAAHLLLRLLLPLLTARLNEYKATLLSPMSALFFFIHLLLSPLLPLHVEGLEGSAVLASGLSTGLLERHREVQEQREDCQM